MDEQKEQQFSVEPMEEQPVSADSGETAQAPGEPEERQTETPKKKRRIWLKITALMLAVALVATLGRSLLRRAITSLEQRNGANAQDTASENTEKPTAKPEQTEPYRRENTPLPESLTSYEGDKTLSAQQAYAMNVDAVCGIATTETTNVFGQSTASAVVGSGFVLTEDGYVVTNNHVVEASGTLSVKLHDGSSYPAAVIGGDALSDVALLKIEAEGLSHVAVGDSDKIAVGESCIAIGNPLGELTFTMTGGYVSALPREINISGKPINMFQTDAAINAGNSGGPLFDMNGNVIGITSAKYSGVTGSGASIEGVGFAIPINDALRVVYDLQEYGFVRGRAYLGITLKDLDSTTAETYGLPVGPIVQTVVAGSCAEKAGIQVRDIILAFNGTTVKSYTQLVSAMNKARAGDTVTIKLLRSGAELEVTLTLDERPEETLTQGTVDNTEEYNYYYDPESGE